MSSLVLFVVMGWLRRAPVSPEVDALLAALNQDQDMPASAHWPKSHNASQEG